MKSILFIGFCFLLALLVSGDEPILLIGQGEMGDVIAYPTLQDDDESQDRSVKKTLIEKKIPILTPENIANTTVLSISENASKPNQSENEPVKELSATEKWNHAIADSCHYFPYLCDRSENQTDDLQAPAIEEQIPPKTSINTDGSVKRENDTIVKDEPVLSNIQIPNRFNNENPIFFGNFPVIRETDVLKSSASKGKHVVTSSYNYSDDENGYDVEYHYKSTYVKAPTT